MSDRAAPPPPTPPPPLSATSRSKADTPEGRLAALGIVLPTPTAPLAAYVPAKAAGSLLFVSGQVPLRDGALIATGTVPTAVPIEVARDCARQCAVNALAAARAALGSLDRVAGVVRVGCFVASEPGFGDQPKVANAASELLGQVFGEAGRHARAAVGCPSLPLNAPVEVEFLFEVR